MKAHLVLWDFVMRTPASAVGFEDRIGSLVHSSVVTDLEERERHIRFMITRLIAGCAMLAGFPIYLALFGQPEATEILIFACMMLPLLSVAILSRTGSYEGAIAVSSMALSGIVLTLALGTGGVKSPMAIWFVAVPLEAMFSGSLRAIRVTIVSAVTGLLALALFDMQGFALQASPWSLQIAVPIMALSALSHVAAVGIAVTRTDIIRRASAVSKSARDQAVLEAIGDLVTWHDDHGQVTFASHASEQLLGVPSRHILGKGLFERVQVADRPAYLKAISDAASTGHPITVEIRLLSGRQDNIKKAVPLDVIWVEMKVKQIRAVSEDEIVVAVMRDITQAKNHEEEMEEARANAVRANDLKGRFLATVSHELRTPLNAIIGFSEILGTETLAPVDPNRRAEYARIIHSSGHHLLDVVNTLLDISKIETGNFDISPEKISLTELVSSCCDLMQLKAEEGGITLQRSLPDGLPDIMADQRACRQVVINLLSNAVKFTPRHGTISIDIRRDGSRLIMAMTDSGIGIAEADLPRLGDPFFQAKSSYDRPYEGTGLGLSVVRGLVGLHHGDLSIESSPGVGTRVSVSLPIDCRLGQTGQLPLLKIDAQPRKIAAPKFYQDEPIRIQRQA